MYIITYVRLASLILPDAFRSKNYIVALFIIKIQHFRV